MQEAFGVSEENWRDATSKVPHFVISETPSFVGRAVAAVAAEPDRMRWNGQSLSSGELAQVYGFTDLDGSRPDAWRYLREVQDAGKPADANRLSVAVLLLDRSAAHGLILVASWNCARDRSAP